MIIEQIYKREMLRHIESAISYLEMSTNIIECDNNFNQGQSKKLDQIYNKCIDAIKILESIY
ncbi:hypothetical protein [Clostridium senegalense]